MTMTHTIARMIPAVGLIVPVAIALGVHLTAGVAVASRFEAFAETFVPNFSGPPCFESSGGSVTCRSSSDVPARNASVDATARASTTLGVVGSVDFADSSGFRDGRTQSSALMGFTDMIIASTLPQPAPFVTAAINLDVHGNFASTLAPTTGSSASTTASTVVEVAVESPFGGMPFRRGRLDFFHSVGAGQTIGPSLTQEGDFVGNLNIPPGTSLFAFESLAFPMPVGRPFAIDVFLRGDVSVSIQGQATVHALLDFNQTLAFPALRPVITLPDGYTLNSVDAQIVDNRFVGGAPASVPEPGTLSLLGVAAVAAMLAPRRFVRR